MSALRDLLHSAGTRHEPLILVAPGDGQMARYAVEAGADVLIATTAALYRHLGIGSLASLLPYGNANEETEELLRKILPRSKGTPMVAGVMAGDPTDRLESRLERFKALGVQGIVNLPTVGFVDAYYRQVLEREGLGIANEIALLTQARSLGLATFGFAQDRSDAARLGQAGVDALIVNLGLTRKVSDIFAKRDQLQEAVTRLNGIFKAVGRTGAKPLRLVNGGPLTDPEDLEELRRYTLVDGFVGGAVFETIPVQEIVGSTIRHFKSVWAKRADSLDEAGLGEMIGQSPMMKQLFELIRKIAPYDVNVCIEGESGTGKELVATLIHRLSPRAHHAFITLNCGAIPDTLVESEMFGHEKGAFTGAHRRRLGKFELAHRGTLFLDEIGDLSPHAQVALLRAIQQREINRVGGESSIPVDVRIITASHQSLGTLVNQGRFRADLYYRLNNITLTVPALREHQEDIPLLAEAFLSRLKIQLNRKIAGLSSRFYQKLSHYQWPGNVRELQHVITQAALLENSPVLEGNSFAPAERFESDAPPVPGKEVKASFNKLKIIALQKALQAANGNKSRAAAALGITRNTLYSWLQQSNQKKY